jgi:FMN phosphatase YigB (HAD superfamily)
MTIRAAIFDVYGTLLEVGPPPPDADAHWDDLLRRQFHHEPRLDRLGFSVACSAVIVRHHAAARARGVQWPEVLWPAVVAEVVPELAGLSRPEQEEFLYRQMQIGHTVQMTNETAAALRQLEERHCLLGIASNAQEYTLRELRDALVSRRLAIDLFDRDLCFWSFEHGFSKPDPHVFQTLTARLAARGIAAGEILMVGDRLDNDIEPARSHGWQTWQLGPPAEGAGGWVALLDRLGI